MTDSPRASLAARPAAPRPAARGRGRAACTRARRPARAGNRRFWRLSALRALDCHRKTRRALKRPRAGPDRVAHLRARRRRVRQALFPSRRFSETAAGIAHAAARGRTCLHCAARTSVRALLVAQRHPRAPDSTRLAGAVAGCGSSRAGRPRAGCIMWAASKKRLGLPEWTSGSDSVAPVWQASAAADADVPPIGGAG